jgi:hypothetical protein
MLMKSSEDSEPLDLERDLPTSPEDIEALRRARQLSGAADALEFFEWIRSLPHQPDLRLRRIHSASDEPFELL